MIYTYSSITNKSHSEKLYFFTRKKQGKIYSKSWQKSKNRYNKVNYFISFEEENEYQGFSAAKEEYIKTQREKVWGAGLSDKKCSSRFNKYAGSLWWWDPQEGWSIETCNRKEDFQGA